MDTSRGVNSQHCNYPPCRKRLAALHALFSKGPTYTLNGSRLCSEQCFRAQLRSMLESWLKAQSQASQAPRRNKIGLILLAAKVINAAQLEMVLEIQKAGDSRRMGELVQQFGYATEKQITTALSRQEGLPWLDPEQRPIQPNAGPLVPKEVAATSLILPVGYDSIINELHVISASPVDRLALEALEQMNRCRVTLFVGPESKVRRAIDEYYTESPPRRVVRPLGSLILQASDSIERVIDGACRFYLTTSASSLEVARCRELLWMRSYNSKGPADWFVFLRPQNTDQEGGSDGITSRSASPDQSGSSGRSATPRPWPG